MHLSRILIIAVTILFFAFVKDIVAISEDILFDKNEAYDSEISGSGQNVFNNEDNAFMNYTNNESNHGVFLNIFSHELDTLTSNGVLNVMMDVMLQSIVKLKDLQNIIIFGHNNPTINCNNSGGIYFEHCHNCTISGITWEKCGNTNGSKPAIELYDSSEIIIQNCTFKHSVTQALTLSEMSRFVTISSCRFALHNGFKGHGIAVHYISRVIHHSKFQFTISNCNFTLNGAGSMSVVYISPSNNKSMEKIVLADLQFLRNLAIPIYISHQNVFASGCICFNGNLANSSGGILTTNDSNVVFHASDLKFNSNKALIDGGVLHVTDNSSIVFEGNSTITIDSNQAKYGAAFYIISNSSATFSGNTSITVNNSQATNGGAFYMFRNSHVKFEENSTLQISNSKATNGGAIYMEYNCSITLQGNSRQTIYNNQVTTSGGAFHLNNSIVTFKGSPTVTINNNQASIVGGAFTAFNNARISFEGNYTAVITNNQARHGGAFSTLIYAAITFKGAFKSTATISNNKASTSGGAFYISTNCNVTFGGNSMTNIDYNNAKYGAGIYASNNSHLTHKEISTVVVNNNQATEDGGALYMHNSDVKFEQNAKVMINNNKAINHGGAFCLWYNCNLMCKEGANLTLHNNSADVNGGAIFARDTFTFTMRGNAAAVLNNNKALGDGGALYAGIDSVITFQENSLVKFTGNEARHYGGALYLRHSCDAVFKENTYIAFHNNRADLDGGAVYASDNSNITVKGNSMTIYNSNIASGDGGALYANVNGAITFQENSTANFNDNKATHYGGALCSKSKITFEHNCTITFHHNEATQGGAIFTVSNTLFKHNSKVHFSNNRAFTHGGALHLSNLTLKGNTLVTFTNNEALLNGGALYSHNSTITVEQKSTIIFINNNAENGGAVFISASTLLLTDYINAIFDSNIAGQDGGAIYCSGYVNFWNNGNITIRASSTMICNNNKASGDGGAMYINVNSAVAFQDNCTAKFKNNMAAYFGGAIGSISNITFENNCALIFNNNEASQGGAIFTVCDTIFKDNTMVQFNNNRAATLGGALHAFNLTFEGSTIIVFNENEAKLNGGALYSKNSSVTMKQNSTVTFITNSATNGGAVFISASTLMISQHSYVTFDNNIAGQDGGAIHLDDQVNVVFNTSSVITFSSNIADSNGGAIYSKITRNKEYFNISEIHFSNNVARIAGNLLYIDVTKSCNGSCLADRMAGISPSDKEISTSPNLLKLYSPAFCISNDSAECERYYINNIMLGQEITIHACLLDHYNKPAEATQFKIIGDDNEFYSVQGSSYASISCNHTIDGISIIGNKSMSTSSLNHSIVFTSYSTGKSVRKIVSVNLTIGLSPCHPGFQYHRESQKCECYNNSGIVFCSGSSSAVKRGYWFGSVTGIPTVTFCPINYCNFTCCKTTNGYYELSPVRVNQCKSHRSGTACGSCEEGYTLSFDSPECVDVNKCTTGQTILIVTLTVFYWFIIIVAVFVIMYCQVSIGYFYAITYYYSVVDILLSQHTDVSNRPYMYHTVTILSSIAKITPQFLGHLCLLENMSGIDQQFIHYVHPLAVSVILIIICWLARNSKRLSMIISKGIIRAICFLLLLSYTSMATTSLLLMRSLTFADVDNVYTYLSPDIKYFHDRHLAYGIIAIVFALLIVIGLPLLLLLEPFLNGKINFVKIKPLLDQFQGCYKDNYRWFAAFYMICRLIVISIIIANLSDTFIAQYLLITATTIMALIHLLVRPYVDNTLNMSDGAILQLMVLVTVLPLFEYFDTYDSTLVMVIIFVLVILPLIQCIVIKLITSKQTLKAITKKTINYFSAQNLANEDIVVDNVINNTSTNFVSLTIDDNMRKNAIICEM